MRPSMPRSGDDVRDVKTGVSMHAVLVLKLLGEGLVEYQVIAETASCCSKPDKIKVSRPELCAAEYDSRVRCRALEDRRPLLYERVRVI